MRRQRLGALITSVLAVVLTVLNTGPAQTSAVAFNPAALTGLKFWMDPSDASTVTSSGGRVSQVNDKSGSGHHVSQATAGERPAIGSATLNTQNVLTFDGNRSLVSAPLTLAQPVTMFAVARSADGGAPNRQIIGNTSSYCPVFYTAGGSWRLYAGAEMVSGVAVDSSWHSLTGVVNTSSSEFRIDQTQVVTGNASTQEWNNESFWIGSSEHGYFYGWIGDIAEMIIYDRVLTNSEIGQVESYLDTKWFGAPPASSTTSTTTTTVAPTTTTVPAAVTTTTAVPALVINVQAPATTAAAVTAATTVTASTSPAAAGTAARSAMNPAHVTTTTAMAATTTVAGPTATAPPAPKVEPGQAAVRVGGRDTESSVTRQDNQVVVAAGDVTARLSALDTAGQVVPLDSSGNVRLQEGSFIQLNMAGFKPGSEANIWMMSKPVKLGSAEVDAKGAFSGQFRIPAGIPDGSHRIVVDATTATGEKTTITVGVIMGGYGKESNIGTWLIVTPIVLAVLFALFIPAVRRRRAADNPSPAV